MTQSDQYLSLAVVTVTYKGGASSPKWAEALAVATHRRPRNLRFVSVIAVDNASSDGTAERLRRYAPWVEVLAQERNQGFAYACNIGIRHARNADLIILLNPDVTVDPDFFVVLGALQWEPDVAAIGPQVIGADGRVEQSARRFPGLSTGLFGRTALLSRILPQSAGAHRQLLARPEEGPTDVDWVSGACLIAPRDLFERVGLLDEDFFMYWEDADWCRRAANLGLRVQYQPSLVVRHAQGSSSSGRPFMTTIAFHRSAFRYFRRHSAPSRCLTVGAGAALAVRCAVKLGAVAVRRTIACIGRPLL